MSYKGIELKILDNHFIILPQKALYWTEKSALLISDIHLGKTASFRVKGFPIPGGTTTDDLNKLSNLIERFAVETLYILGDFFHAKSGRAEKTLQAVSEWRKKNNKIKIILVRGNHDKMAGDPPADLRITCVDQPLAIGNIYLSHNPTEIINSFVISGHIHPSVRLFGKGKQAVKVSCFLLKKEYAVLPAFGGFTGTFVIIPEKEDRIFIPVEDEIIEVDKKFIQKKIR